MIPALFKDTIKQFYALPECRQKGRITLAHDACNAEGKCFGTDFDLC